jgi:hypothetical protein
MNPTKNLIEPKLHMNPTKNLIETKRYMNPTKNLIDPKLYSSVPNVRSFAFFTGNTIRLALDMKNSRIFVSALGSKSVHCIDFAGCIVWCKAIPSPRGIVFIPEASSDMNMIVASKQWNIIYKMNSHNGTD